MKNHFVKQAALVFLAGLFLFCAGCGESPFMPPDFTVIGTASTDTTEGKISYAVFEYTKPESLRGMTLSEEGGIISAEFSGITKTSDKFPQVNDFEGAQILLSLYALSNAEINLSSVTGGNALYTASCPQGEFTVTAESSGRVVSVRNETTGFAVAFSYGPNE